MTPAVVALVDAGIAHTIHEYDRGDDLHDFGREAADALGLDHDQVSSGYILGGISPIGQRRRLRTVIDETAELFDTVYVSGGRRGMDIGLAPGDLIGLLDAIVAPITA